MDTFHGIAQVAHEFGLGQVLEITRTAQGNSPAFRMRTQQGTFFVKSAGQLTPEWIQIYRVVEQTLNSQGVRQARMLFTLNGGPVSTQGYSAFEFLPGSAINTPNERQFEAHVEHLAKYNRVLSTVVLDAALISRLTQPVDLWRKAASLEYMLDRFRLDPTVLGLQDRVTRTAEKALALLRAWRPQLEGLTRQLIHSDVGPGNILYDNDRVVAIVDFTPGYAAHLYGLCISLFWHCVFSEPDAGALSRIATAARVYSQHNVSSPEQWSCFFPLMVRAAAYRLFARLLARAEVGRPGEAAPFSLGSTERMAGCVERVLGWESLLRTQSPCA